MYEIGPGGVLPHEMGEFGPFAWLAVAGAAGGVLNACVSQNLFLWPVRVSASSRLRIVRPGLVLNALVGAAASFGALLAFGGAAPAVIGASSGRMLLALVAAVVTGALAARAITNEADKRLLRAALSKACSAPAAHPDTARAMEIAPPFEVFRAACELTPHFRTFV